MASTIRIAILANAAKAKAEMQSLGKESGRLASTLKAGIVGGAVVAGAALGAMAASAITGARESAQIHRVLESQINNMGAAARTAFSDATGFAEDYGKAIGKDDDDILKVINKLSTFPAAFGKGTLGAEGMRRATQAAFDLEAAGIGSAESNIIGLGKALDNPIKGLTALSKSGVSFTEEQKKQITNFTKQGKLAEAQKVLLQGIETNAKGAAKEQADGLTRAKVSLDGIAEGLASKALPLLDKFGNFFVDTLAPKIESFFTLMSDSIGAFVTAFQTKDPMGAFTDGLLGVQQVGFRARQAFDVLKTSVGALITVVSAIIGFLVQYQAVTVPVIAGILAIVAAYKAYMAVLAIIRAATLAYTAVQAALNVVMALNPIGLVILAIVGLVAALVVAYKRSETFRRIVDGAFRAVTKAATAAWNWVKRNWPLLLAIITGPIGLAVRFVVRNFDSIVKKVKGVPKAIKGAFSNAKDLLVSVGKNIVYGLWNGITGLTGWLIGKVQSFIANTVPGPIRRALGLASPSKLMKKYGAWTAEGLALGMTATKAKVASASKGLASAAAVGVAAGAVAIGSTGGAAGRDVMDVNITVALDSGQVLKVVRKEVRINGGNVQTVLGR